MNRGVYKIGKQKVVPIAGATGGFEYNALTGEATPNSMQKLIWGFQGNVGFEKVLEKVDSRFSTKFQEIVFSKDCGTDEIESSPFQLTNGLMVVDRYRKFFSKKHNCLIKIVGTSQVVNNREVA